MAAAGGDAWSDYCKDLSPASRRARCAEQQSASRESWCAAEWQDRPPSNMGPWADRVVVEPLSPRRCDDEGAGECCYSPIVIDILGDGFDLTDAAGGVAFDITGRRTPLRLGWTADSSDDTSSAPDDVWLALDRDENGTIDSGLELFGNFTEQPPSRARNGFIALAEFDQAAFGGNGDSRIDAGDHIFSRLRLWHDRNHNGISEKTELFGLPALGVAGLSLEYEASRITDEHGNEFRYRARVLRKPGSRVGAYAYDVFLVSADAVTGLATTTCRRPRCSCTGSSAQRSSSNPSCFGLPFVHRYNCTMHFGSRPGSGYVCVLAGLDPAGAATTACRRLCEDSANAGFCGS